MIDNDNFLVSREVAERTGLLSQKYRTADGRFILDRKSLGRITLKGDEFISGIQGVEKITREEALTLIAQNGYVLGDEVKKTTKTKSKKK